MFDLFMILCIIANCIVMGLVSYMTKSQMDVAEYYSYLIWFLYLFYNSLYSSYTFTAIYTVEFLIKIISKGFFINSYTYLRDPWNWLDFLLIVLSYSTVLLTQLATGIPLNSLSSLRGLRVFRAFKTVNIIPGS